MTLISSSNSKRTLNDDKDEESLKGKMTENAATGASPPAAAKRIKSDTRFDHTNTSDTSLSISTRAEREKQEYSILTQENVGIRSFISPPSICSFSGIIKHRFNDFHVHEIDQNGQIVVLTSVGARKKFESTLEKEQDTSSSVCPSLDKKEEPCLGNQEPIASAVKNVAEMKTICQEIGALAQNEKIPVDLYELIDSFSTDGKQSLITCPVIPEKEKRTATHGLIRKLNTFLIDSVLDSKTINSNEIILTISKKSNRQKKKELKPNTIPTKSQSWSERGDYCHFTLFKENKDTMDAISLISKLLRLDAKLFTFCGTKDKRGVTTQRVSAYRVSIERLVGLNKTLRGIKLGNFQYEKEKLQLGDSKGNHFTLVIREVKPTFGMASPSSMSTLLQTCIETLSTKGFINYFGMQRFGSRQVSTHKIGACLLSGQWQEACHLILGRDEPLPLNHSNKHLPRPASSMHPLPDFFSAKTYLFENWDLKGALDLFPRYCTAERAILNSFLSQQKQNPSLTRDKWNYLQAIQSITRNLRLMYVHAYQSRVWNEMVSLRHERYGMILVPGDLVRLDDKDDSDDVQDQNEQADLNEEDQGYKRRGLYNVKALQNEDDLTQYSIYDLVLPLPGTSVIYPENMKKEYIDFMAMDGFDPLEMKRRVKDVSLPGFYRCVYALPSNVKGELKRYSDQSSKPADFILTDLDKLASHKSDISQSENDTAEGDLYAFVLEFGLASSQYATMLLREIMKSETSASFQSTLSSASKDHLK